MTIRIARLGRRAELMRSELAILRYDAANGAKAGAAATAAQPSPDAVAAALDARVAAALEDDFRCGHWAGGLRRLPAARSAACAFISSLSRPRAKPGANVHTSQLCGIERQRNLTMDEAARGELLTQMRPTIHSISQPANLSLRVCGPRRPLFPPSEWERLQRQRQFCCFVAQPSWPPATVTDGSSAPVPSGSASQGAAAAAAADASARPEIVGCD